MTASKRGRNLTMKMYGTLLALTLAVVPLCGMAASTTPQNHSVTRNSATLPVVRNSRLDELKSTPKQATAIERVGGMSSRPWTEIVGWHPGASQFPDAENHGPGLTLLSVNF